MTRRAVCVPASVGRAMLAHARRDRPRECCGFLIGRAGEVAFSVAMPNIAQGNTRYRIDDAAHFALRRLLRDTTPRLEIVGVYHSHPAGEARPSSTDLAESMYPKWIYIIVGLRHPAKIRGFVLRNGRSRAVTIRWSGRRRTDRGL